MGARSAPSVVEADVAAAVLTSAGRFRLIRPFVALKAIRMCYRGIQARHIANDLSHLEESNVRANPLEHTPLLRLPAIDGGWEAADHR